MASSRSIHSRYRDPLDELWFAAAKRIGFSITRSSDVFASSDGRGQISIASAEHLDADDCLAQMIFHELCHSLVEGHDSFELADWGLENSDGRDEVKEHACLRTQAHLATRYGLRAVLAPTTDFRAFYDALEPDPLEPRHSESSLLATAAIGRAARAPWAPQLSRALSATAVIARAGADHWPTDSLFAQLAEPAPMHPTGLFGGWVAERHCGGCGWRVDGVCTVAKTPVQSELAACDRFEAEIDCATCGACCREGFGSVTVDKGDPMLAKHPSLVANRGTYLEVLRDGPRCAALQGGPRDFHCSIYSDRPRCCRDLERGGEHCLTARGRVGLSI